MSNPTLFLYTGNGTLAAQDRSGSLTLTGSGAVRYAPAEGARINHAANPCLATNGIGWEQSGGALVSRVADSDFRSGYAAEVFADAPTKGLKYGVTGGASATPAIRAFTIPGSTLTIGFDAKLVSGDDEWEILVQTINASGGGASSASTTPDFTPTAAVSRFVFSVTLPSNAGAHGVLVYWRPVGSAVGTIRVSSLTLVLGSDTGDYFDGSTGGVWLDPITGILGSANASPSVSQAVAWVEEGTTNQVQDPSFENGTLTTYWTAQGSAAITKVTTHAWIGSNAAKVSCTASTGDGIGLAGGTAPAASNGQAWTVSGRVRAFASGDVGKTMRPSINTLDASRLGVSNYNGDAITLTDSWQYFSFTATIADVTAAYARPRFFAGAAVAVDFVLDAVQFEQKAYATSYCDGSIGTGYAWSGTAHASSSTRTATTVTTDNANRINVTRGAYAIRALRQLDVVVDYRPLDIGSGGAGTDRIGAGISGGTDRFRIVTRSNSGSVLNTEAASPAIAVNTWYALFAEWSGTAVGAAVGTNVPTAGSRDAIQGTLNNGTTDFFIGSAISSAEQFNGYIGPILIADRPLTANERATLNARTSWGVSLLSAENVQTGWQIGTLRRR